MYSRIYNKNLARKLAKIKSKDPKQYQIIIKKIEQIRDNPEHRYKDLHYSMKGIKRVHIGPFVLIYLIRRL